MIARRVENLGLVVDIIYLSPTVSLADALDAAANRGLLYAVIVTSQHELHKSVTLTILHGRNPQGEESSKRQGYVSHSCNHTSYYTVQLCFQASDFGGLSAKAACRAVKCVMTSFLFLHTIMLVATYYRLVRLDGQVTIRAHFPLKTGWC